MSTPKSQCCFAHTPHVLLCWVVWPSTATAAAAAACTSRQSVTLSCDSGLKGPDAAGSAVGPLGTELKEPPWSIRPTEARSLSSRSTRTTAATQYLQTVPKKLCLSSLPPALQRHVLCFLHSSYVQHLQKCQHAPLLQTAGTALLMHCPASGGSFRQCEQVCTSQQVHDATVTERPQTADPHQIQAWQACVNQTHIPAKLAHISGWDSQA